MNKIGNKLMGQLKFYASWFGFFTVLAVWSSDTVRSIDAKGSWIPIVIIGTTLIPLIMAEYYSWKTFKDKTSPRLSLFLASILIMFTTAMISAVFTMKETPVQWVSIMLLITFIVLYVVFPTALDKRMGDTGKDTNTANAGSRLNPKKLLNGYLWSAPQQLKNFSTRPINTVYVDNFRYYPETKTELGIKEPVTNIEKETTVKFSPLDFTKTILVLGGMGSGKTEFILSIANQRDQFPRQFFHDAKGDFTQKLYDPSADFIFNPYDSRSVVYDLWTELEHNETLAVSFFKSILSAASKKDDFWSVRSGDIISDIALDVYDDETIPKNQKWLALANAIEDWLKDANSGDGATKKSLAETVEMVKDLCYLMAFREHNGAKRFTIKEWLNTDTRLFLLNNPAYAEKLTPLFTGFIAVLSSILLSKEDTKSDFTLMVLDEFFALKFDEVTRSNLLTQVRSKGGCLMIGAQYMPLKDKAEQQQIDSSRYAMILFQINDGETIKHVSSLFGSVEFMRTDVSVSEGTSSQNRSGSMSGDGSGIGKMVGVLGAMGGGKQRSSSKNVSTSMRERKEDFLTPDLLASMPQYHHITYVPSEKLVYLGYTEQVHLPVKNDSFQSIDSRELRRFRKGDYIASDIEIEGEENGDDQFNYWSFGDDNIEDQYLDQDEDQYEEEYDEEYIDEEEIIEEGTTNENR